MDWIPVVFQLKSAFQAITLDLEGARRTQENFANTCPIVSQVKSAVEALGGDCKAATETQMQFVGNLEGITNGMPVVGHVKGAIHYAVGDKDGGDNAMKAASRTTGVIGGAVMGTLVGRPVGGVAGAVTGGLIMDGLTTGIDSAVHQEYKPFGNLALATKIFKGETHPWGHLFDLTVGIACDGFAGYGIGKTIQSNLKVNPVNVKAKPSMIQTQSSSTSLASMSTVDTLTESVSSRPLLIESNFKGIAKGATPKLVPPLCSKSFNNKAISNFLDILNDINKDWKQLAKIKESINSIEFELNPVLVLVCAYYITQQTSQTFTKKSSDSTILIKKLIECLEPNEVKQKEILEKLKKIKEFKLPNYALYSLVCHGETASSSFTVPPNFEIWFFTPHGHALSANYFINVIRRYFQNFLNTGEHRLEFDRNHLRYAQIIRSGEFCPNYFLYEFTDTDLRGWTQDEMSDFEYGSMRFFSLCRFFPDYGQYGLYNFRSFKDVVVFLENETNRRVRNETVILAACFCRGYEQPLE